MQAFDRQVLTRLPLAEAMWMLLRYVVTPSFASELFERHRCTGSERLIEFGTLVELVARPISFSRYPGNEVVCGVGKRSRGGYRRFVCGGRDVAG